MRHDPLQESAETDQPTSPRSTVLQNLRAYSTHVTVPAQLVAVHIPLTPFRDLDHCETMPCEVLTSGGIMRRREFISLVSGAAAAWPLVARAQAERMRRIGVLMNLASDDAEGQARLSAFHQGLQQLGWTVALLTNPTDPVNESTLRDVEAAAIGQQILAFEAATGHEIDSAFESLVREKVDALFVAGGAFFSARRVQVAVLAARYAVPATYSQRIFVQAGGLMSYGSPLADTFRQVGLYAARILKGAQPVDLPVMQSTKFELVINLNTARALRFKVPPSLPLLALADEVIE